MAVIWAEKNKMNPVIVRHHIVWGFAQTVVARICYQIDFGKITFGKIGGGGGRGGEAGGQ